MNAPATINGHPAQHALQEIRNARGQVGHALAHAKYYLQIAHATNTMNNLGYDIPSGKEISEAIDAVNKSLNP